MTSDSLAATMSMMASLAKTVGHLVLSDVVAWGACPDTAIARVMTIARSRLGDMLGLDALVRSLLASLNFSLGRSAPGKSQALQLRGQELLEMKFSRCQGMLAEIMRLFRGVSILISVNNCRSLDFALYSGCSFACYELHVLAAGWRVQVCRAVAAPVVIGVAQIVPAR